MIQAIQDYPSKGIVFRHIGPLLEDPVACQDAIQRMADAMKRVSFDCIGVLDARGFLFGPILQKLLGKPVFMIRKESKLPGPKYRASYSMEYGDPKTIEIERLPGKRVALVDDVLATGGTMRAAIDVVRQAGGEVVLVSCLIGLDGLGGAESMKGVTVQTLFNYPHDRVTPEPLVFKEYRPVKSVLKGPALMWHPSLESMAQRILRTGAVRPSYVDWPKFPDGWPNMTFEGDLRDQAVTFLFSMEKPETFLEQMSLLIALPRQGISSLDVVIPYLGPATHERVDFPGMLATVEPVLKMMSVLPLTKQGPARLHFFDIHALPIQFYPTDQVQVCFHSAIPLLKRVLPEGVAIVFPDDGAYKRFHHQFEEYPVVICGKIRQGEERHVTIQDRKRWPFKPPTHAVIVDDLVQSGGTMIECAKALSREFTRVDAYATHAVFPKGWDKFIDGPIHTFYVTNTNPSVTDHLPKPFHVLEMEEELIEHIPYRILYPMRRGYGMCYPWTSTRVASMNEDKLRAVARFTKGRVFGCSVASGVSEQPLGPETMQGAVNRLPGCDIAIESGLMKAGSGNFREFVAIATPKGVHVGGWVDIPPHLNVYAEQALADPTRTFGSRVEEAFGYTKGTWLKRVTGISREDQIYSVLCEM